MQALELLGTLTGLVYLYFEYRASIWLWAASIVMPAIYIFVYYDAGFYADMGINVYYLAASGYGWALWMRRGRRNRRFAARAAETTGEESVRNAPSDPAEKAPGPNGTALQPTDPAHPHARGCETEPKDKTGADSPTETLCQTGTVGQTAAGPCTKSAGKTAQHDTEKTGRKVIADCKTVPDGQTATGFARGPGDKIAPGSSAGRSQEAESGCKTGSNNGTESNRGKTCAGKSKSTGRGEPGYAASTGRTAESEYQNKARPISSMPAARWLPLGILAAALFGTIAFVLIRFTDSTVPYGDSFTTALSIVGMWMLAQKYVEQWLVWIAVDLVCAGLYFYKGLYPTACLYALYTVIAVFGYLKWLRMMKNENAYA